MFPPSLLAPPGPHFLLPLPYSLAAPAFPPFSPYLLPPAHPTCSPPSSPCYYLPPTLPILACPLTLLSSPLLPCSPHYLPCALDCFCLPVAGRLCSRRVGNSRRPGGLPCTAAPPPAWPPADPAPCGYRRAGFLLEGQVSGKGAPLLQLASLCPGFVWSGWNGCRKGGCRWGWMEAVEGESAEGSERKRWGQPCWE